MLLKFDGKTLKLKYEKIITIWFRSSLKYKRIISVDKDNKCLKHYIEEIEIAND